MADIGIVLFDPAKHGHLLPEIVNLHIHSVEYDNTLLRYHPPFDQTKRDKMTLFWKERIQQVSDHRRIIFLALTQTTQSPSDVANEEIAGLVELGMPEADTGPFRGDVEMLMVSPKYRKHGIGKRLIYELERVAKEEGRILLVSPAKCMRVSYHRDSANCGKATFDHGGFCCRKISLSAIGICSS